MSVNSLEKLLASMKGRSVCRGWGAITAFGRAQLNRLLEEQYIASLNNSKLLPPLSGYLFVTDDQTESVTLDSIILGKPELSFKSASLNTSRLTLTMNIIAGTYTNMSVPSMGASKLLSDFSITEDQGFKVEMTIDLRQLVGEVDKRGRVTLDLASDPEMTCNLGSLPGIQKKVAAFIQGHLAAQPDDRRSFELGLLDFSGYNPLAPTQFYIRTQRAPGSESPLATNHGDGAVVVFIRLKVKDEDGAFPVEGSGFPYLIPDDKAQGKDLYSASLVLNSDWIELADEGQLDILKNLLFPGENVFVESPGDPHRPHDLLVLGNVKPTPESLSIEPLFISLDDTKDRQFIARRGDGSVINNARWSVSSPDHPLSAGGITPGGGKYTPLSRSRMSKDQVPTVVTARYTEAGREHVSSALVMAVFESMSISPRVCVSGVGKDILPLQLAASTVSGGELIWPTLDPSEGVLTVIDNNHAVYAPPITQVAPLTALKIKVRDKSTQDTIEATVVLLSAPHTLPVDPAFVPFIAGKTPIQLRSGIPSEFLEWEVIGEGGGEVDESGLYTPPVQVTSRTSVVQCTYSQSGVPLARGFSIIQLSEPHKEELRWSELEKFSISTNGGPDQCYTNGLQQIPVVITIETKPFKVGDDNYYIPVSDVELSTLTLVDKITDAEVPFTHVAQDGIEYESGIEWAASKKKNRFTLYSPTAAGQTLPLAPPVAKNNNTRYRELYIHLAKEGPRTFYARFKASNGRTWNSKDLIKDEREITVQGVKATPPTLLDYKFERERVYQDPLGHDEPDDQNNPNRDVFSYYRQSTDYWRLNYLRLRTYPVGFATLLMEQNISTIQWESELLEETFFSYTGYAFNPANYENSDSPAPEGLSFDVYQRGLMNARGKTLKTSFDGNKRPSPGQLIVSLHRTDDVKYWHDGMAGGEEHKRYRKLLDGGVKCVLLDEEGNRHPLQISFEAPTLADSRNKLIVGLR
ncbi:hypothetical protein [Pseudomonas fluorescens]|uniref:Imidazoleglycerol-phosphate synthase n=1 Tax=Pseudomonas fluorescens TaxID=294 RepID=A0A5E7G160_PSEFL|nr:hypothetical protein [Pseudomonas fluorescens]VVO42903.1 hypothetical protein PS723_06084 [Pseudomonas fluorescens]